MVPIKSREVRFEVFQKDILDWGSKLKEGTSVYVVLRSKSPVSNQRAVSVIRYIGPLPKEDGIQFGVEIQEEQYRHHGSSNGYFGGEQYFECEENCGLFVSLDRLYPMKPVQQDPQPELPLPTDSQRQHQMTIQSQRLDLQSNLNHHGRLRDHSPKQPYSRFRMNDRVVAYNKQGIGFHGTAKWIEEVVYAGSKFVVVGIETDISVQSMDFVGSLSGFGHHFKCMDSRHGKLVMPESMVTSEEMDAAQHRKQKEEVPNQETSIDTHHAQIRDVAQQREDEYLKGALQTGRIYREQQIRLLREIKKAHKGKKQNAPGPTDSSNQPSYQHPSSRPPGPNEQHTQPSTGASVDTHHAQIRDVTQQREDEYLKGALQAGRIDREQQIRLMREIENTRKHKKQNAPGNQPYIGPYNPQCHYEAIPGPTDSSNRPPYQHPSSRSPGPNEQRTQPSASASTAKPRVHTYDSPNATRRKLQKMRDQHSIHDDHLLGHHPEGGGGSIIPLHHQWSWPGPDECHQTYYQNIQASPSQYVYHQQQHGALQEAAHGIQTQPQGAVSCSFSLGSTIQLRSNSPQHFGVIRWIGTLPGILEGRIAGVDLEDPMEGCSDGTWNGLRYFNCRPGHGFFAPLSSLLPDERFVQAVIAATNPLDDVPLEEQCDQVINPGQIQHYIGDKKGIQGHQNSCYLDSTVFGLFAVSDEFDNMFLQPQHDDPHGDNVKHLLWKGIVNPLRKYGAVRYE